MLKRIVIVFCVSMLQICFADGIESVKSLDSKLVFEITTDRDYKLVELKSFEQYEKGSRRKAVAVGTSSGEIRIARFDKGRDRIYSKFALIDSKTSKMLGDYKYVTSISNPINGDFKLPRPKSIKGVSCVVDLDDAVELGVKYVHENVHINEIADMGNKNPQAVYEFDSLEIPLNMNRIKQLDERMKTFTDNGIAVFTVFINQMPSDPANRTPLVHPNSDIAGSPTHLGAFNITDELGLKYYLGILEFLAERYTRADKKYGLMSSLIVGNEVQQHYVWHNMGDMPEDDFVNEYETSLRLAWLVCNKFNPDFRVYVSMDHHWTKRGFSNNYNREIPGDVLLTKIAKLSNAGGDYPWNVAFHPYPENLFEPRFWYDKSPEDDFSTPRITFKNMQVLSRFLKQPNMLSDGNIRDIAFTEQGFHTPDGLDGEKIQAAAYAYAYYKITQMPEVSAFILHRHADHRGEGGLKLGLWNNKPLPEGGKSNASPWELDDAKPWKKKYIWKVFKYADTDQWERAFAFAKPILGIENWGDSVPDKNPDIKSIFKLDEDAIVYDFIKEFDKATATNNLECRPREVYRAAGWLVPAIFQHPSQKGVGTLEYKVKMPKIEKGQKISLIFETIIGTSDGDGVNYSISVNDKEFWSAFHKGLTPKSHLIDMTRLSGREVSIKFIVDKNKELSNDWAYWVSPVLVVE